MIADFAGQDRRAYSGPFVSFWTEDEASGPWKVQVLGACSEGRIRRDVQHLPAIQGLSMVSGQSTFRALLLRPVTHRERLQPQRPESVVHTTRTSAFEP